MTPGSTFALSDIAFRRDVRKAHNRDELRDSVAELLPIAPVLLQENVIGVGAGLGVLASAGELLVAFQYERVHEPLGGGGSSYRRSVSLDPALADAARRLVSALAYTGVMMIELKIDPATGRWVLIELNGRFWGGLPLAVATGADFPYYLHQLLVEGRREFPRSYRVGLYARNWSHDLRRLRANITADRHDPPTRTTWPLGRVAAESGNVLRLRERSDTFARDDPRPALGELRELAGASTSRLRARASRSLQELPSVRRAKRAQLIAAVAHARRLAFVCTGNISRSAYAETYLRSRAPSGIEITSAGSLRLSGRSSPPSALAASSESGVDLSAHRSRALTRELADWADVLLIFDEAQRSAIERDSAKRRPRPTISARPTASCRSRSQTLRGGISSSSGPPLPGSDPRSTA